MKVYWSRCGHGHGNFGDKLTPLLLRHHGIPCEWAPIEHAELVGVGSVLEKVPENFHGIICTTGFMHAASRRAFLHANVLAVRGRLTRDRIQVPGHDSIALGDAGLLCDLFHTPRPKRFKLGVIPHFADASDPVVTRLAASDRDISVIDICAETPDVIRHVSECEHILSSSLHGLILADSLGIPNQWMQLHRDVTRVEGAGFKFRDYYSNFGQEPRPLILGETATLDSLLSEIPAFARPGIEETKERLRKVFLNIRDRVGSPSAEEQAAKAHAQAEWHERLEQLQSMIARHIPAQSVVLLADDDQLSSELRTIRTLPFLERNGTYWGPPGTDADAVAGLHHALERGVKWFVIAWPMFWLLDRFPGLAKSVSESFETVDRTPTAMVLRAKEPRVQPRIEHG